MNPFIGPLFTPSAFDFDFLINRNCGANLA